MAGPETQQNEVKNIDSSRSISYGMNKIFIHTNDKQGLGALLSKFSFERTLPDKSIGVEFINVDTSEVFKKFSGKNYLRAGRTIIYDPQDLQSFTLSRFMPPEIMGYSGRALVIDPDIFALNDASRLFFMEMNGKAIAACRKKDAWDTSMMVLDCEKLRHWKMEEILKNLEDKKIDYADLMTLKLEEQNTILEMERVWNNLDTLTPETKMIHMTNRLTQPWKTGLPIDFTINPLPKIFGLIPREPIHKLMGKYPTHYLPHPDGNIQKLFFDLAKDAYRRGVLTREIIEKAIESRGVRADLLELVAS